MLWITVPATALVLTSTAPAGAASQRALWVWDDLVNFAFLDHPPFAGAAIHDAEGWRNLES